MEYIEKEEFKNISINKGSDLLVVNVSEFIFFASHGKEGARAFWVYCHQMLAARLQETNRVYATNTYLSRGTSMGKENVKKAKAWLAKNGFIKYVKIRDENGTLGQCYTEINFLRSHFVNAKIGEASQVYQEKKEGATTGSENQPLVNQAPGFEHQMLKALNIKPLPCSGNTYHYKELCKEWYLEYSQRMKRRLYPTPGDYNTSLKLFKRMPDLTSEEGSILIKKAISNHFTHWKRAWYLIVEATRKNSDDTKKPDWNFNNFCNHFSEIILLDEYETQIPEGAKNNQDSKYKTKTSPVLDDERDRLITDTEEKWKGDKR